MKTEHTPGPWEAKRDPYHYDTLSTVVGGEHRPNSNGQPNRRLIVQVGGFADWREQEANARMIEALPDLLEALQDLVQINEKHNESISKIIGRPLGWKDTYLDKARAAIAKATGKEEA